MGYILYEQKGHVGLVTINRPDALNALNSSVISEFIKLLDDILIKDIRCLIVTGAGEKAFVAGADISEMRDLTPEEAHVFSISGNELMSRIESFPMPTIAAVNGYALGGGFELALACDLRIAGENAVFALPETSLGIVPGYGGIQRLSRIAGIARAKEMAFTCRRIKALEALSIGIVNKIAAEGKLLEEAFEMAEKIAGNAPFAVKMAKAIANQSAGLDISRSHCLESPGFGQCFETEDQLMAMSAFLEKKKCPPFTGIKKVAKPLF